MGEPQGSGLADPRFRMLECGPKLAKRLRCLAVAEHPGGRSADTGVLVAEPPGQEEEDPRIADRAVQPSAFAFLGDLSLQQANGLVLSPLPVVPHGAGCKLTQDRRALRQGAEEAGYCCGIGAGSG